MYSLQRLVYDNIIDHIQKLSTNYQFGFLPKRSTLQQLLVFAKNVLEPKCEVDVVYMDFRKVFDTVSHYHFFTKTMGCWNNRNSLEVVPSASEATIPMRQGWGLVFRSM